MEQHPIPGGMAAGTINFATGNAAQTATQTTSPQHHLQARLPRSITAGPVEGLRGRILDACPVVRTLRDRPAQVVHGWLAATGFGVLIPLGMVVARTLKVRLWPASDLSQPCRGVAMPAYPRTASPL